MSPHAANTFRDRAPAQPPAPRAIKLALLGATLLLIGACGFLWMRYGAQIFLDAALFAWRTCF